MRLIDADKVMLRDISRGEVPGGVWYTLKEDLDEAPTVEAIPVEWVKKYLAKLIVVQDDLDYPNQLLIGRVIGIEIMLEEWKKRK